MRGFRSVHAMGFLAVASGFMTRSAVRNSVRAVAAARAPAKVLQLSAARRATAPRVAALTTPMHPWGYARGGATRRFASTEAEVAVAGEAPTHPSFELVAVDHVEEYDALLWRYKHKKTGAEVLSVGIEDDNKVFGVTFRTPPDDSTGLPHILEHSVLCGSRQFPTKEPFVELLKGSLQTFLNAFTYPDRTCYPVASQNVKDFYNLMNVYLDAVFFPRAISDPQVLAQEGWHYELEDPSSPLVYKGVVFNEMKGVYSSPDALMGRQIQRELFRSNTYHVDSGGDPTAIPQLTFDQFQEFHRRYYHPSNARVYFYGDDNPTNRLETLDKYLSEFDAADPDSKVKWESKVSEPWSVESSFPARQEDVEAGKSHMVSVNWLLNDEPLEPAQQLGVSMLDYLLLNDISSPLYRSLVESNLGSAVIGGGLSSELLQSTFSVGLKGVSQDKAAEVEPLILSTLEKIAKDGFPKEAMDACVNSVEFSLREFNTGSFPRGLSFMLGAMREWIYDGNPAEGVRFEAALQELKDDIAARGDAVFVELLETMLSKNGHRMTMTMAPDAELEKRIVEAETEKLAAVKATLSAEEIDTIIEETKSLKAAQAREDPPEAKASIPALTIDDLDPKTKSIPIEVSRGLNGPDGSAMLVTHELPSNGILYADVGLDLSPLAWEELPLVALFSDMLLECGTKTLDETQMTRRIGTHTGGVRTAMLRDIVEHPDGQVVAGDEIVQYLFLRGKAVPDKVGELFAIIKDVVMDVNLDRQSRVIEMLRETKASMEASVVTAGHSYAATRLAARDTGVGALREHTGGITYLKQLGVLLEEAEKDWDTLRGKLETIREKIVDGDSIIVNLTGDKDVLESSTEVAREFASSLPKKGKLEEVRTTDLSTAPRLPAADEGIVVPTQVNYVGMAGRLYSPGEVVDASSLVINNFLRTGHLWDTVRVMGGAYGGFCSFDRITGRFGFLSYRDPNLVGTLENYKSSAEHLMGVELDEKTVQQAVIGTIGDLDSPRSVDAKGFLSLSDFLAGRTDEQRQKRRDEVLATDVAKVRAFGERLQKLNEQAAVVVVGSEKAIQEAKDSGLGLDVVPLKA